jgi:hypothetical protein
MRVLESGDENDFLHYCNRAFIDLQFPLFNAKAFARQIRERTNGPAIHTAFVPSHN